MSLHTNAIDLCAVGLDELDNVLRAGGLASCCLDVVIVVVQFRAGIGGRCGSEGNGDVCLSDRGVEDTSPVSTVVVQGLIDDIPVGAFAFVVGD